MKQKLKKLTTFALSLIIVGTVVTGCGSADTPPVVDEGTKNSIIETYSNLVNDAYNHNKTTDELDQVSTQVALALGDNGDNYEAALEILKPVVPTTYVYVTTDSPADIIASSMRVFNIMTSNTINDKVTVTIDPTKISLNDTGDIATISYSGITFVSEQNDTTGLATMLNDKYRAASPEEGVKLYLTDTGWKVDMLTFQPEIPQPVTETPEPATPTE